MKNLKIAILALLFTLPMLAGVTAAPSGIAGVRLFVVEEYTPGDTNWELEIRFFVDAADPNQNTGDWTYNLTAKADGAIWVNLGDFSGQTQSINAGGIKTQTVEGSGDISVFQFNVTTYDGVSTANSCIVSVDVAVLYDYDDCGEMTPVYDGLWCLEEPTSVVNSPDIGFGYSRDVRFEPTNGWARFYGGWTGSIAGINLAGDSSSNEFTAEIRAQTDTVSSRMDFFFSTVDTQPGIKSSDEPAEGVWTAGSTNAIPNTGAFASGFGALVMESGGEWRAYIHRNSGGVRTVMLDTDSLASWTTPDPNTVSQVTLAINEQSGMLTLTIGSAVAQVSLTDLGALDNAHSFWLWENGGSSSLSSATEVTVDGSSTVCLGTLDGFGGGLPGGLSPGAGGVAPGVDDTFEDEGGYKGAPSFPGVDVQSGADGFGITDTNMGFVLFAILILMLGGAGFAVAGIMGAIGGLALAFAAGYELSLIPGWLLVVIFALAIGSVAVKYVGRD